MPDRQINDPSLETMLYFLTFLSQQLPHIHIGPLKGFLSSHSAIQEPSTLPCALLPEPQRYKDIFRCDAFVREVQGYHEEQLLQTLIVQLLKTHLIWLLQLPGSLSPLPWPHFTVPDLLWMDFDFSFMNQGIQYWLAKIE